MLTRTTTPTMRTSPPSSQLFVLLANYSATIGKVPTFEEMCDTSAGYPEYSDFFWK